MPTQLVIPAIKALVCKTAFSSCKGQRYSEVPTSAECTVKGGWVLSDNSNLRRTRQAHLENWRHENWAENGAPDFQRFVHRQAYARARV